MCAHKMIHMVYDDGCDKQGLMSLFPLVELVLGTVSVK